jgi:hypothetical protein
MFSARQSSIEFDFQAAEMTALFQRGKIKKTQVNRFFDFINQIAGQQNSGDVSFLKLYDFNRVRIKAGILHGTHNFRLDIGLHGSIPILETSFFTQFKRK